MCLPLTHTTPMHSRCNRSKWRPHSRARSAACSVLRVSCRPPLMEPLARTGAHLRLGICADHSITPAWNHPQPALPLALPLPPPKTNQNTRLLARCLQAAPRCTEGPFGMSRSTAACALHAAAGSHHPRRYSRGTGLHFRAEQLPVRQQRSAQHRTQCWLQTISTRRPLPV